MIRERLAAMDPAELARASSRVCAALEAALAPHAAGLVGAFMPGPREPDIRPVLFRLASAGRLAIPHVSWETGVMTLRRVGDLDADTVADRHSIRSARPTCPVVSAGELALVLIPGVAFDRHGARLGRGKGHFDRFLGSPDIPRSLVRVGIAFDVQVVDSVPVAPHDCPVDLLVTESGGWDCRPATPNP